MNRGQGNSPALSLVVLLVLAGVAAAAPSTSTDTVEPVGAPYATVSLSSLKAVGRWATDWGVPLPPFLGQQAIDRAFPFLGGVDTSMPLGVQVLLGRALGKNHQAIFFLPTQNGSTFQDKLLKDGSSPVTPGKETYLVRGLLVHFAPGYIIFGGTRSTIERAVQVEQTRVLAADRGRLLHFEYTPAAVREQFPEALDRLFQPPGGAGAPALNEAQKMGRDYTLALLRTIDRLDVDLDLVGHELRLLGSSRPPGTVGDLLASRVRFPSTVPIQIHGTYPSALSREWPQKLADAMGQGIVTQAARGAAGPVKRPGSPTLSKAQEALVTRATREVVAALFDADAVSLGIEAKAGHWTIFLGRFHRGSFDFAGKLDDALASLAGAIPLLGEKEMPFRLDRRTGRDRTTIHRLTAIDKGRSLAYIDTVQRGPHLFTTISTSSISQIESFASLPVQAAAPRSVLEITVVPGRLLAALSTLDPAGSRGLPAQKLGAVVSSLGDRSVSVRSTATATAVTFEATVPRAVVTGIRELLSR
ncbi:MAG: hypothetical protein HY815_23510 [Candidatus Riflebacteria bacterium]|nr:hypothetical protein [Candidatus Riflebacteria bacterium]